MRGRLFRLGLAAAGLLAVSSMPALAQLDDFLCSTFSYKCAPETPAPPPQLAPEAAPAEHAAKPHKTHMKTAKRKAKAKAAKTEATKTEGGPAPAPAPAASDAAGK